MTFALSRYPKKINLGCGLDKRDGFLNVDINSCHHPDLVCDITNLHVLPSSYYDHAIANDILEHIPRLKTRNVLKEWNRILVLDGKLELRVPNVLALLSLMQLENNSTPAIHETFLQKLFGTQRYHGDFHFIGFSEILLVDMLRDAGFAVDSIKTKDEWLFVVLARKISNRKIDEIFFLDDEEFITAVYNNLLGREPDQGGYEYFLDLIKSGIVREAVIDAIKESDEYRLISPRKKISQEM